VFLVLTSHCSYEEHYASRHRNVCSGCGKILPTKHLLDIHLHESHNPMFDTLSKHSPMVSYSLVTSVLFNSVLVSSVS